MPTQGEVTQLLNAVQSGRPGAWNKLFEAVYSHLRRLAEAQIAREPKGKTLQPTAIIHETYLRLIGTGNISFQDRQHFYSVAAKAMRHILVDDARKKGRRKRGGGIDMPRKRVPLDECVDHLADQSEQSSVLLAVDEAVQRLESSDPELAELVHLRFFAGLGVDAAADVLGISPRTVDNRWRLAKAWLHREISGE